MLKARVSARPALSALALLLATSSSTACSRSPRGPVVGEAQALPREPDDAEASGVLDAQSLGLPPGTSPTTTTPPFPGSAAGFGCSAAGIASYAEQLVALGRQSCTTNGVGVVKRDNLSCLEAPIAQLAPPYGELSFGVVSTLLADAGADWPFLECTYFVQAITTGVCGTPISPAGTDWRSYPLAHEFANKQIPGFTWIDKASGAPLVGDIMIHRSDSEQDPGHIMIVAEVIDATRFRIVEANMLNPDGSEATLGETGVVSATRIEPLENPRLVGWYRWSSVPPVGAGGGLDTGPLADAACDNPCSLYGMLEGECRSDEYGSYLCQNACSTVVSSCSTLP